MAQDWDVTLVYGAPNTGWVLDAGSTSTVSVPLDLSDDTYFFLREQSAPMPELEPQYVSAMGVDGDRMHSARYRNRRIQLGLDIKGSTAAELEDKVKLIEQAVGRINRDAMLHLGGIGGTLKHTSPSGATTTFDVINASVSTETGLPYYAANFTQVSLTFECRPFGRGEEVTVGTATTTTAPVLTMIADGIPGDVPALGRLRINEDDNEVQAWVIAALRSRNYSDDVDAALFYEAEGRTCLGGSAAIASTGYTGAASGSGSNVIDADGLGTAWEAIMSTQAVGGGSQLQHVGHYRVFARVQAAASNAGTVGVAWEWAVGDFRAPVTNAATYLTDSRLSGGESVEDAWMLVDLGVVSIPPAVVGAQYWEGRLVAKSTAISDGLFIDYITFKPVDEFYAEATASSSGPAAPGSYSAVSDFTTESGAITGDALATGGNWTAPTSAYEADDFTVSGGVASRAAASDASTDVRYGRWVFPSTPTALAAVSVQVDMTEGVVGVPHVKQGVVARAVDKDNFLVAYRYYSAAWRIWFARIYKVIAGTPTLLTSGEIDNPATCRMRLTIDTAGTFWLYGGTVDAPALVATGQDTALATGGTLASGRVGIYDWFTSSASETRTYDNFYAWVPTFDAAMFNSQSMEFRHDGVFREGANGSFWQPVAKHNGDLLYVPPSYVEHGENRVCEVIIKACRNDPRSGADTGIDDISATLYATPRYLQLPG